MIWKSFPERNLLCPRLVTSLCLHWEEMNLQEVGHSEILCHWRVTLKGTVGLQPHPFPLSRPTHLGNKPCFTSVTFATLPHAPKQQGQLTTTFETRNQNKPIFYLFKKWLSQVLCYRNGRLTSPELIVPSANFQILLSLFLCEVEGSHPYAC